jgi:hypothetical protein
LGGLLARVGERLFGDKNPSEPEPFVKSLEMPVPPEGVRQTLTITPNFWWPENGYVNVPGSHVPGVTELFRGVVGLELPVARLERSDFVIERRKLEPKEEDSSQPPGNQFEEIPSDMHLGASLDAIIYAVTEKTKHHAFRQESSNGQGHSELMADLRGLQSLRSGIQSVNRNMQLAGTLVMFRASEGMVRSDLPRDYHNQKIYFQPELPFKTGADHNNGSRPA